MADLEAKVSFLIELSPKQADKTVDQKLKETGFTYTDDYSDIAEATNYNYSSSIKYSGQDISYVLTTTDNPKTTQNVRFKYVPSSIQSTVGKGQVTYTTNPLATQQEFVIEVCRYLSTNGFNVKLKKEITLKGKTNEEELPYTLAAGFVEMLFLHRNIIII